MLITAVCVNFRRTQPSHVVFAILSQVRTDQFSDTVVRRVTLWHPKKLCRVISLVTDPWYFASRYSVGTFNIVLLRITLRAKSP